MADDGSPQIVTMAIIKCNLYGGMNYLFNLEFNLLTCTYYRIARGKFGGEQVWRINSSSIMRINRSVSGLSIVSTKLDDFSLVNHGRFAKFAKLSPIW